MAAAYMLLLDHEIARGLRRERVFRDRSQPLEFEDQDIRKKYRFSRTGCMRIIELLTPSLRHETKRNRSLPPSLQCFIALNYFATGAVLDDTATIHGVSRMAASRAVHKVASELHNLRSQIIKFPKTQADVTATSRDFHQIAGLPRVVGAVDGTHVCLSGSKLGPDEHIYTNRKGRYSINVQLVGNARYRITNVVSTWPGSTHDSRILLNSKLGKKFSNGQLQGILLGDSGYPLKAWLMTPLLNPTTDQEVAYNNAHAKTRSIIEQINGQIKSKFRCLLGSGLPFVPERSCIVISACCVLFNLSKEWGEEDNEWRQEDEDDDLEHVDVEEQNMSGVAVRAELIRTFHV